MTKNRWIALTLLLALAGLAAVFGVWDLAISTAAYSPENGFAVFMEEYAILLEPALLSLAGVVLCVGVVRCGSVRRGRKLFCCIVLILGSYGYLVYQYAAAGAAVLLILLLAMALADGAALLAAARFRPDKLRKLMEIAAVTAVFIIAALAVVTVLKTFWGRVRFREMTDLAEFSRWFIPQGINGHHSFPSGHTSNAATLWALTLFAPLCGRLWAKALCYVLPSVWILMMAVARIMAGAHYASDTLFAAAITLALFYAVRGVVLPRFSRGPRPQD